MRLLLINNSFMLLLFLDLLGEDVSPLDVSPPGRFAHSLDVSPPTVDVSPPSAFYVFVVFLEHRNVTDGWTDRIAINISHKCGDTQ